MEEQLWLVTQFEYNHELNSMVDICKFVTNNPTFYVNTMGYNVEPIEYREL